MTIYKKNYKYKYEKYINKLNIHKYGGSISSIKIKYHSYIRTHPIDTFIVEDILTNFIKSYYDYLNEAKNKFTNERLVTEMRKFLTIITHPDTQINDIHEILKIIFKIVLDINSTNVKSTDVNDYKEDFVLFFCKKLTNSDLSKLNKHEKSQVLQYCSNQLDKQSSELTLAHITNIENCVSNNFTNVSLKSLDTEIPKIIRTCLQQVRDLNLDLYKVLHVIVNKICQLFERNTTYFNSSCMYEKSIITYELSNLLSACINSSKPLEQIIEMIVIHVNILSNEYLQKYKHCIVEPVRLSKPPISTIKEVLTSYVNKHLNQQQKYTFRSMKLIHNIFQEYINDYIRNNPEVTSMDTSLFVHLIQLSGIIIERFDKQYNTTDHDYCKREFNNIIIELHGFLNDYIETIKQDIRTPIDLDNKLQNFYINNSQSYTCIKF